MDGETVIAAPIGEQNFPARFTPTDLVNFNTMENIEVTVNVSSTAINIAEREVPVDLVDVVDEVVVIAPVTITAGEFRAGPNPVAMSAGKINFYWSGRRVNDGMLTVFDAFGNVVSRINIIDGNGADSRVVGSWDLTDSRGRLVSAGSYLVRGTITDINGNRERVSVVIGVR
jgi:hypothetical protein